MCIHKTGQMLRRMIVVATGIALFIAKKHSTSCCNNYMFLPSLRITMIVSTTVIRRMYRELSIHLLGVNLSGIKLHNYGCLLWQKALHYPLQ